MGWKDGERGIAQMQFVLTCHWDPLLVLDLRAGEWSLVPESIGI